jgi:hypothetical protein
VQNHTHAFKESRLAAETDWLRLATKNLQTAPRDCWQCETAGLTKTGPGQLTIRIAGYLLEADEGLACTAAYTPSLSNANTRGEPDAFPGTNWVADDAAAAWRVPHLAKLQ